MAIVCVASHSAHADPKWISVGTTSSGDWYIDGNSVKPFGANGASYWVRLDLSPESRKEHSPVVMSEFHIQGECDGDTETFTSTIAYDDDVNTVSSSATPEDHPVTPKSDWDQVRAVVCGALKINQK